MTDYSHSRGEYFLGKFRDPLNRRSSLVRAVLSCSVFVCTLATSTVTLADTGPLTLRRYVSYHANADVIFLVFKENVVELTTNTYTLQEHPARLGWFRLPMDRSFTALKKRIEQYHVRLLSETLPDPPFVPHAPIWTIWNSGNEKELSYGHPYFEPLEKMIFELLRKKKWNCVKCATYAVYPSSPRPLSIKEKEILEELVAGAWLEEEEEERERFKRRFAEEIFHIDASEEIFLIERTVEENRDGEQRITRSILSRHTQHAPGGRCWSKGSSTECLDDEFGLFILELE